MSTAATAAPALSTSAVELRSESANRGWINSAVFDLAFFTLSPLSGLALAFAAQGLHSGHYWVLAAVYLIGIPHYLSSFTFYLGDENRNYYWSRRLAFVAGPALVFVAVVLLRATHFQEIVFAAMFLWNIYHIAAQSSGILSLYRRLANGLAAERPWARHCILCTNAAMVFWHIERYQTVAGPLARLHPMLPRLSGPVFAVAAIAFLAAYIRLLLQRERLPFPEVAFLGTSLLLFHPYLWLQDYNLATLVTLMGHFLQYLAIVWLLHRRKYAEGTGSIYQQALAWVSRRTSLVLTLCFLVGCVFLAADLGSHRLGHPLIYITVWNALTLMHFYVDGLIWQFKQPFVRRTIGPYLTLESHRWA